MGQQKTLSQERIGQLYMLAAMAISGTIGFFVLASGQRPFNVVFFRCAIGAAGLSAYCLWRGYFASARLDARGTVNLVLGALTLIANWCFLFTAYRMTSVGITTVVYNVQPFLLLIGGFLINRERPSRASVAWLALSFAGLVILAEPHSVHDRGMYLQGIACALAAATLYAATTLLTRSLAGRLRPEVIAAAHMIVGTAVFLPLADFAHLPVSDAQIGSIAALGLVHTTFMYVLLYGAFQKAQTSSIAVLSFVYPLVAVAVDYVAYGLTLNWTQLGGGVLIVAAAVGYASKLSPLGVLGRWARRPSSAADSRSGPQ